VILVVGENVVDVLPDGQAVAGGGPANTAIALTRLGIDCAFAARLGGDPYSRLIEARLSDARLAPTFWVRTDEPSPVAQVSLDGTGGARYRFQLIGAADFNRKPGELPTGDRLSGIEAVHLGSLAAYLPPGADVIEEWIAGIASRVLVSFDPNIRATVYRDLAEVRDRTERYSRFSHHIRASTDDLAALYGTEPVRVTATRWLDRGVRLVVITNGRSVTAYHRDGELTLSAPKVTVVDTIGAGDSFTAGLLAWWRRTGALTASGSAVDGGMVDRIVGQQPDDLRAAMEYAMAVAAINCTRRGADPPTHLEVEAFEFA